MRHRKKINHLGRKSQHRKAMLSNMASSLILHKRIFTTLAKAKALRVYVEPLITKSKEDSTHSRRTVFAYLQNKQAVSELFREVSQKVAERPGGYTRILKTGFRQGDAAEMCFIELVDYNTNMLKTTEDAAKKTRRSRRGKKASDDAEPKAVAPVKAEEKAEKDAAVAEEKPEVDAVAETPAEEETKETEAPEKVEEVSDIEEPKAEKKKEEEPEAEIKKEPKAEKKEEPDADDSEEAEDKKEDKKEDK